MESIKGQLGEAVSIVVEPERRNTFPAIALSAAYLYFEKNCPMEETVVVLPVDPYVGEEYFISRNSKTGRSCAPSSPSAASGLFLHIPGKIPGWGTGSRLQPVPRRWNP